MITHYFAYGSNMNPARMRARGLAVAWAVAGRLPGFALCFDKRASHNPSVSHANIRYAPGSEVQGALYRLHSAADIDLLDRYEGSPVRYSREVFAIATADGAIPAWVYVANRAVMAPDLLPDRRYLNHLLAGRAWHSPEYHRRLLEQPCVEEIAAVAYDSPRGLQFND